MKNDWTPYGTAQALLEALPALGRLMSLRIRESGTEEATIRQIGTLMQLREKPITTSELAKQNKVSLQAVSVLVQGLVERGWLTRVRDPEDRRQWLLEVTPEGIASAEAAKEQITGIIAEILSDLSPEALTAAGVFLPALHEAIQSQMVTDLNIDK